jgi:hypothetical protein
MSNEAIHRKRFYDVNGLPVTGAQIFYYAANTTSSQAVFTDESLTVAHPQPVVADGNGYFPDIYLTPGVQYRELVKDAGGVTIWDDQSFYPVTLDDSAFNKKVEGTVSPMAYGANGTGSVNDQVALQNAINSGAAVVDLQGRTFRTDSGLVMRSNLIIKNGTIDGRLVASGAILGSSGALAASRAATSISNVTVSAPDTSGIAAGDWLYLIGSGGNGAVDIAQVASVVAGTITLTTSVIGSFTGSMTFAKITQMTDVHLDNLQILGPSTGATKSVDVHYSDRVTVVDCRFVGVPSSLGIGILAGASQNLSVRGCRFATSTGTGVFIALGDTVSSFNARIENSVFENGPLGVLPAGRGIVIRACVFRSITTPVQAGAGVDQLAIEDCRATTAVLITGGSNIEVSDHVGAVTINTSGGTANTGRLKVARCIGAITLTVGQAMSNVAIEDNEGSIAATMASGGSLDGLKIRGNRGNGTSDTLNVLWSSGGLLSNAIIADNSTYTAMRVEPTTIAQCNRLRIERNDIFANGSFPGIYVKAGRNIAIADNEVRCNSTQSGIKLGDGTQTLSGVSILNNCVYPDVAVVSAVAAIQISAAQKAVIAGNRIQRSLADDGTFPFGILIDTSAQRMTISENQIQDVIASSGGSCGIIVNCASAAVSRLNIVGNQIVNIVANSTLNIAANALGSLAIVGNYFEATTPTSNVSISATTTLDELAFTGNVILGGTNGVTLGGTVTNAVNDGNAYSTTTVASGSVFTAIGTNA